ncbi:MAG: class II fumarate hydratase [Verrucomicrobiota bacterium]
MRTERDSMGEMQVPDDALYGASTQRAVENFPISGHRLPPPFIRALGLLKAVSARANAELGRLPPETADLIERAAREVADGVHADHFPVDVFQTGSGTSTNTNANEVIANRARQLDPTAVIHPNDHVNLGQSSNDTIPTALHLSVAVELQRNLAPALTALHEALAGRAAAFADVIKAGRTHLMDAVPVTLGQVFSGYAAQVAGAIARNDRAVAALRELAIGGTAVGTGLNTHPDFARRVCLRLSAETGMTFHEAPNHFEAQGARDGCAEVAGLLATTAGALSKIAADIRLLGSGPRNGLAEIKLPAIQPGSSIMPGKVNPVLCESLIQVGHYVQGLAVTVQSAARDGQLELNVTLPLQAHALHEMTRCLANAARRFAHGCVAGIEADADRCRDNVERSLMLVTALTPAIGYDAAAAVAKEAHATGRTLREVVLQRGLMDAAALDRALDPRQMLSS